MTEVLIRGASAKSSEKMGWINRAGEVFVAQGRAKKKRKVGRINYRKGYWYWVCIRQGNIIVCSKPRATGRRAAAQPAARSVLGGFLS